MERDKERSFEEPIHTTICDVGVQFCVTSESEHRALLGDTGGYDEMFEDMFSEMHEDDVFFEIGAHIGITSCVIGRRYPDISIVCFEPHPRTRECLETNLELNDINAIVMGCAISNSDRTITFDTRHTAPDEMGEVRHSGQGTETPVRTLDRVVTDDGIPSPTVIMSDIVGEESNLLRGGSTTFSSPTARLAYIVTHDQPLERIGSSKQDVKELLRRYGFDEMDYLRENLLKAKKSRESG